MKTKAVARDRDELRRLVIARARAGLQRSTVKPSEELLETWRRLLVGYERRQRDPARVRARDLAATLLRSAGALKEVLQAKPGLLFPDWQAPAMANLETFTEGSRRWLEFLGEKEPTNSRSILVSLVDNPPNAMGLGRPLTDREAAELHLLWTAGTADEKPWLTLTGDGTAERVIVDERRRVHSTRAEHGIRSEEAIRFAETWRKMRRDLEIAKDPLRQLREVREAMRPLRDLVNPVRSLKELMKAGGGGTDE